LGYEEVRYIGAFRWLLVVWVPDAISRCTGERFAKAGRDRKRRQLYRCTRCGRRRGERSGWAFWGYRFPDELIALTVRWYFASARIVPPGPLCAFLEPSHGGPRLSAFADLRSKRLFENS
jgi:hypothetical protein